MKNIYKLMMALVTAIVTLSACSVDNDPFITADEFSEPRILNSDLTECKNGEPFGLPTIYRDANFVYEVTVTPAEYTTVHWIIDGEDVFQGTEIDMPLLAGEHDIQILARTTQNKEAVRNCLLTVLPVEGDPAFTANDKNLYCQMGTAKTIEGANLAGIQQVIIGGKEVPATSTETSVTFDVPELEAGEYQVVVATADMKYGCGKVTVSPEKWVEPGIVEEALWEGSCNINWGDSNVNVPAEAFAELPVGTVIKVHYTMNADAEYYNFRVTTPWWGDNASDDIVPQCDLTADSPNPYEIVFDEHAKALIEERGGMLIVGFGFTVTKVSYEKKVAPSETVVWEGDVNINWGDSNVNVDMSSVPVGAKVNYYYTMNPDAEYYNFRVTTPWWGDTAADDVVAQMDLTADTPNPYVSEFTEANKAICDERGGILVVGFGFHLTKVSWSK